MKLASLTRLFVLLNRGTRRRLIAANVGLILGVTLVAVFVAAGTGLRDTILTNLLGTLPIDQLKVQPRSVSVGVLKLGRPGGSEGGISESDMDALRALPQVTALHPIKYAHFPVSIKGEILGSSYGTDAPLQGVSPDWVASEVAPGYAFASADTGEVPLLLSRKILQAYNVGFAAANRLPRLTESAIVGEQLQLELGASALGGTRAGRETRPARIVGFSDRVDALALAVPIDVILHYTRRFGDDTDVGVDALVIHARSHRDLSAIENTISSLGLELAPDAYLGRQVGQAATLVIAIMSAIGVAVVLISLSNVANTLQLVLRERQFELAVVRASGVSARLLRSFLILEAALSGVASALVGLLLSLGVLAAGGRLLAGTLEPILGTSPRFAIPLWLVLLLLVATPLASGLAAILPARHAVGRSIAMSLRR